MDLIPGRIGRTIPQNLHIEPQFYFHMLVGLGILGKSALSIQAMQMPP